MAIGKGEKLNFNAMLKAGIDGAYVFYGEEEYLKNNYMSKLISTFSKQVGGAERTDFTQENFSVNELSDEINNMSFGASAKVIVLRNIDTASLDQADKKRLNLEIENADEYSLVIFHYDDMYLAGAPDSVKSKRERITKLSKVATLVECKKATHKELTNWLSRHFQSHGKAVSERVLDYLVSVSDMKMSSLVGEVKKLCIYAGDGEVTVAHIDKLVRKSLEANVFDIAGFIVKKRYSEAIKRLDLCKKNKDSAVMINTILGNSMSELLYCKAAYDNGFKSAKDVVSDFKLSAAKEYFIRNHLREGENYDISLLKFAVKILMETDVAQKSGGGDEWILLESAIMEIADYAENKSARVNSR